MTKFDLNEADRSMMAGNKKIRLYFYTGTVVSLLILGSILSVNKVQSLKLEMSQRIDQLSDTMIKEKKIQLKNSIDQAIYFIDDKKNQLISQNSHSSIPLSEEDLETLFRDQVKSSIRELRIGDNGYVWINEVTDFNGGDGYAFRFVHPNLPETEGNLLSTKTEDVSGGKPYAAELEGINTTGELYHDYYFKEMNSDKISHKLSYAKLYVPENWIVATGIYLNDVDLLIENEKEKMQVFFRQELYNTLIVTLLTLCGAIIILVYVEKQISKLINKYNKDIKKYAERILSEKEKADKALEEVKTLQGLLPICSHCKKIRDDSGYWNQMEQYIESHSDASFSHSLCPECADEYYKDEAWYKKNMFDKKE